MTRTQQNYKVAKFFLNRYCTAFQPILKSIEDFNKIVVTHLSLKNFDVEIPELMENSYSSFVVINQ